jgi:hypothetical protein
MANVPATAAASSIREHLAQMAKKTGGDHFHVHATEDGKLITHQVEEGGKVQAPVEHKNLNSVKKSLAQFLDEEGSES